MDVQYIFEFVSYFWVPAKSMAICFKLLHEDDVSLRIRSLKLNFISIYLVFFFFFLTQSIISPITWWGKVWQIPSGTLHHSTFLISHYMCSTFGWRYWLLFFTWCSMYLFLFVLSLTSNINHYKGHPLVLNSTIRENFLFHTNTTHLNKF